MRNESEIVKILREEEKQGKLPRCHHENYEQLEIPKESFDDSSILGKNQNDDSRQKTKNIEAGNLETIYKTIFENSAIAITFTDEHERIIQWNKYAENLLDMSRDDLWLKPVKSLYPAEEWQKIRAQNIRQKGMQYHMETKIARKDNHFVDVEISLSVLKNNDGNVIGSIGILKDITIRKHMEQALEESNRKFKQLYEKAPVPYHMLSSQGIITDVNEKWCQILGYRKAEVIGKTIFDFIPDAEREAAKISFDKKIQSKQAYVGGDHERTFRTSNGETKIFTIHDFFSYDEQDNVVAIQTTMGDITERIRAEHALRESEERYKSIIENSSEVIMLLQPDGTISYMSPACEEVLGYRPVDLIGKNYGIAHPDDTKRAQDAISLSLKGQKGSNYEYRIITQAREIKWISHSWSPVIIDGKLNMIVSVITDITDRKHTEEKLTEAHEMLQSINKELERKVKERTLQAEQLLKQKDEFVSQLGHDLKTPLSVVLNILPLIKEEIKGESITDCEVAIRNVKYISNLVTDTLKLAELNSPNVQLNIDILNLHNVLAETASDKKILFEGKHIIFNNLIDNTLIIKGDKLRIRELFDNLLSNAITFTPDDGAVTVNIKNDVHFVTISVTDSGIGMTPEQINRVFDEFYKADSSRHKVDSSGLGLSICKRIVEKHGGKIWVESLGIGKGSTIYFTLPTEK